MQRRVKGGMRVAVALCLWLGGLEALAQEASESSGRATQQPQEYTEYESIPPPHVELRSDVATETPEEPQSVATSSSEEAPSSEQSGVSEQTDPDPIMDEVKRELDMRSGAETAEEEGADETRGLGSTPYNIVRAFVWLLVVVAMILLVYYVLQRRTSGGKLLTGGRLGTVLGRIYLNPRVCLHYVRTGGKVLVVGQTQNALSLIAEFGEEEFADTRQDLPQEEDAAEQGGKGADFFSQLRTNLRQMGGKKQGHSQELEAAEESETSIEEDDIAALRGDIHRLQEYLRDSTSESER